MPVQLELLESERESDPEAIWSQLPAAARAEIVELLAALAIATAVPSPTTEEAAREPVED
jgi:hypothetical protein